MHILLKENSVKVLQVKTNLEPQFSGDTIVQYNSEVDARNTIETAVVANIWSSIQGVQLEIGEIQFRPFGLKKVYESICKTKVQSCIWPLANSGSYDNGKHLVFNTGCSISDFNFG